MPQFLRPDSDVVVGTWTASPLYESINEVTASTTDIITGPNKADGTCEIGLSDATDPASSSTHVMRVNAREVGVPVTGINLYVQLYQGTTLIKNWMPTLTDVFGSTSYTLTAGEADAITDYTDLRVKFYQDYITGASGRCYVAWFELEVPDVPPRTIDKTDSATASDIVTDIDVQEVSTDRDVSVESIASTVTDTPLAVVIEIPVSASDSTSASDIPELFIYFLYVAVYDNCSASDVVDVSNNELYLEVSDGTASSDAVFANTGDCVASVSDIASAQDNGVGFVTPLYISTLDNCLAEDETIVQNIETYLSVDDSIVSTDIVEDINIFEDITDREVSGIVDMLGCSDATTVLVGDCIANVYDTVSAQDSPLAHYSLYVDVQDTTTSVLDVPSVSAAGAEDRNVPDVLDTITAQDSGLVQYDDQASISDTGSVQDFATLYIDMYIDALEGCAVSDYASAIAGELILVAFSDCSVSDVGGASMQESLPDLAIYINPFDPAYRVRGVRIEA